MKRCREEILVLSPCSSGMNPCDFILFQKLTEDPEGRQIQDVLPVLSSIEHSVADINN